MKIFAVFMTILMLSTGFDLCVEENDYRTADDLELRESGANGHEEDAPCSPFCHCSRCPFSIMLPSLGYNLILSFLKIQKPDGYVAHNPLQFSPAIWQPPRHS